MNENYGKNVYNKSEDELIEEENRLSFVQFDCLMAKQLFNEILIEIEKPREGFNPMAVEIVLNNMPIFTHYQYGSTQKTMAWIKGKRKTVEYFGLSSACVDVQAHTIGIDKFYEKFGINSTDMKICGGAFPIIVQNLGMVGIISVSGLSRREDHEICVKALTSLQYHK